MYERTGYALSRVLVYYTSRLFGCTIALILCIYLSIICFVVEMCLRFHYLFVSQNFVEGQALPQVKWTCFVILGILVVDLDIFSWGGMCDCNMHIVCEFLTVTLILGVVFVATTLFAQ